MRLKDKVIIITGASSGIGAAAAHLFAKEGAKLVLGARRKDKLNHVVSDIIEAGGEAVCLAGDVQDADYACQLVRYACEIYGTLNGAFNNAGMLGELGPVPDMTFENWQAVLSTNLTSAFFAAKYQIPEIIKSEHGAVVFTSSFVGPNIGMPGMAAYGAAKAGLIGLVRSLATEYGPSGLRVNALLPGGTWTNMAREFATTDDIVAYVSSLPALKRMAQPEEIAKAALFMLSDDASFITGQAVLADGGVTVSRS